MAKGIKPKSENDMLRLGVIPLETGAAAGAEAASDHLSVLTFEVGDESFAVGVEHTEGVVDCPRLAPLPSAPDGIIGVVSIRGRITLVMELGSRASQKSGSRRLILIKGDAQLGLVADRVTGIVALAPKKIKKLAAARQPAPQASADVKSTEVAETYFTHEGRRVPIIEVNRLAEA
jgi:purine-binding chemotaxis protein CheW